MLTYSCCRFFSDFGFIELTGSSWDFEVKKGGRVQSISCGIREVMNILLHGIESERDL